MPIFQIQNKKLKRVKEKKFDLEKDLQLLTEENLEEIFGLEFISGKKNKQLSLHNLQLDTLAFDEESKSFVVIEYKRDQSFSVVDQGYSYLALMLNNKAEFILEYNERMNSNLKRDNVDWSQSKVIFIAPSFTTHQRGAIAFRDLPIELWEVSLYEDNIVLYNQIKTTEAAESIKKVSKSTTVEKVSEEVKTFTTEDHLARSNPDIQEVFKKLEHEIFELDSRIQSKPVQTYIGYKVRYHNFCSVIFYKDRLKVYVRGNIIDDPKKLFTQVPESYAWGKTKLWYAELRSEDQINYFMSIIKQGYDVAPDK